MELSEQVFRSIIEEAQKSKGWLKFIGIMMIIGGALEALSIVGIIIAWLPIWMGVILIQAANAAESFALNSDTSKLTELASKLRLYFTIQGIFIIVNIAFVILSIILYLILGVSWYSTFMSREWGQF
ncbi:MAG TPA: hypothetical protein ENG11_01140 [candidate division Zixibacteria bacterium]|nr:hypothetical protein [candidate division Zixibacteria bacterium]